MVDACVIIDLDDGGILDKLGGCPSTLSTTDFVNNELTNPLRLQVRRLGIHIVRHTPSQVEGFSKLLESDRGMSMADASVLVLAQRLGAVLVTGDRPLKNAAKKNGVTVHGTLWVLDVLVSAGAVSAGKAIEAVRATLKAGSRLPAVECQRMIRSWAAKSLTEGSATG
ncbi:MAG TPA: hypothetical protein VGL40_08550 [Bacillota bacterium]